MTWEEIKGHDSRINGVLRRGYDEHGWTPVEDHTPVDELMEAEPEWVELKDAPEGAYAYPSDGQPDLELSALKMEEALQVAAWARRQQIGWICGDGLHPFRIVQRVFALLFGCYKDILGPFNGSMLAKMMGQGRAAFQATMEALFSRESLRTYGVVVKVHGQKKAEASVKYAANAAKHKPKQQLQGQESEAEAVASAALRAAAQQRLDVKRRDLPRLRRQAEARRMAALTGDRPEDIDPSKINPTE